MTRGGVGVAHISVPKCFIHHRDLAFIALNYDADKSRLRTGIFVQAGRVVSLSQSSHLNTRHWSHTHTALAVVARALLCVSMPQKEPKKMGARQFERGNKREESNREDRRTPQLHCFKSMWSHPARNFFGAWVLACVEVQRAVAAPERLGLAGTTSTCAAGAVVYNDTGCTTAGHYVETSAIDADDCCGQCGSDERCFGWTFHEPTLAVGTALETPDNSGKCDMSDQPRVKHGVAGATCGCRTADCEPAPTSCVPVPRPGPSERAPLPAGISQPVNLVSILIDDLGYADTSVTGNSGVDFTPNMQALQEAGIQLGRHHTYLWCSPSRR